MSVEEKPSGGGPIWTILPAPSWKLADTLRGELLSAHLPWDEAVGVELWRAVSKVEVWGSSIESPGALLVEPSSAVSERAEYALRVAPEELVSPLSLFSNLHGQASKPTHGEVALACQTVAEYADGYGLSETAVRYAEAAAVLNPGNPQLANLAGRMCRRAGYRHRAEIWYERAIGLARRSQGVGEYIRAHLGLGNILRDAGEFARALPLFKRAGLSAKRAGLKAQAAEALHDVFTIALLSEDYPRAAVYARRAFAVYPRHHRRFPYMCADFAGLLVRRGLFAPALSILEAVYRKLHSPVDRFQLLGLIAWAAGGAGRMARFTEAASLVTEWAASYPEAGPGALYYTGEGARQLEEWEQANRFALSALKGAETNDDVLTIAFARRLADAALTEKPGVAPLPLEDASGEVLRRLAPTVRLLLRRWRGPTWRPRRG